MNKEISDITINGMVHAKYSDSMYMWRKLGTFGAGYHHRLGRT